MCGRKYYKETVPIKSTLSILLDKFFSHVILLLFGKWNVFHLFSHMSIDVIFHSILHILIFIIFIFIIFYLNSLFLTFVMI